MGTTAMDGADIARQLEMEAAAMEQEQQVYIYLDNIYKLYIILNYIYIIFIIYVDNLKWKLLLWSKNNRYLLYIYIYIYIYITT